MHTAQHLVRKCLTGDLARDRTIILVTHQISLCLPVSTYLVNLGDGKILRQGFVQDLDLGGLIRAVKKEDGLADVLDISNEDKHSESYAVNDVPPNGSGKLVETEARAEGRVAIRTYLTYVRAAGWMPWLFTVGLMLLIRFINVGNQVSDHLRTRKTTS